MMYFISIFFPSLREAQRQSNPYKTWIAAAVFGIIIMTTFVSPAFADCASPSGAESQTRYDFTAHTMYYCNGTDWVEGGGGGGGGSFTCPAGFTKITSQGKTLGCMQTAEEGSALPYAANNNCFSSYGGRLPLFAEIKIAFDNYTLTAETDDRELTADVDENRCGLIDTGSPVGDTDCNGANAYRCFIPASGGGGSAPKLVDLMESLGATITPVTITATENKWPDYIICDLITTGDSKAIVALNTYFSGNQIAYQNAAGRKYIFNTDGSYSSATCYPLSYDINSMCDEGRCGFFATGLAE